MSPPDHLVITAADERQAAGYRVELESRKQAGLLPAATESHVVANPGGRPIGSGGMTLLALHHLARAWASGDPLAAAFGRRALILHAGGESRRLPAYAAGGKLFTPLPCRTAGGHPAALFDVLFDRLQRIPPVAGGHVLVAAGDVLPTFDPTCVRFNRPGITGVAFVDGPERAARHGVYVLEPDGRVSDFLQKPDRATLRAHGILDEVGGVLIDTGLLSFCPEAVETLSRAAGFGLRDGEVVLGPGLLADLRSGAAAPLDLYTEVVLALPERVTAAEYERRVRASPRNADPAQLARLRQLYRDLHGIAFRAAVIAEGDFLHLGTSRELLVGLTGRTRAAAAYGFRNLSAAAVPAGWPTGRAFAFNAVIEANPTACAPAVLLEAVHARGPLEFGGRNIVTGLPGLASRPIRLPEGIGLSLLPVGRRDDWAAVVYGVDDGSASVPDGWGRFLNAPLEAFLRRHGLEAAWLWPQGGEEVAYTARLWCRGHPDEVLAQVAWMLAAEADAAALAAWRGRQRWSLAELVRDADHERLHAHRAGLRRLAAIRAPFRRLVDGRPLDAARLAGLAETRGEVAAALADVAAGIARRADPLVRARSLTLAAHLQRRAEFLAADAAAQQRIDAACRALTGDTPDSEALDRAAAGAVARAVVGHASPSTATRGARVDRGRTIWATAPARLDFAGGWTDTPPICLERGGAVINAAVTLDGRPPVQVFARWNDAGTVRLTSIDLGRQAELDRVEQLLGPADPADWAALPKACLGLAGLTADRTGGPLSDVLRPLGGGIDLTLFSALPRGSGLGTSSILGMAILACLARLRGEAPSRAALIRQTMLLEQRLTTGGGWQDQVGGLDGGVKLIRTRPGPEQAPEVRWLAFDATWARRRMLLYDTGIRRLARGILRNVVGAYLAGDPRVMDCLEQLKAGVPRLRAAIESRDLAAFGAEFRRYWELKRRLAPGVTPPRVEALIARVRPHCAGWGLLGAGGGGFFLMVARSEGAARRLRAALTGAPAGPGARFVAFAVATRGLEVGES